MIHILPHFQKHNRLLSTNMTAHLWTVSSWHASLGYSTNSEREIDFVAAWLPTQTHHFHPLSPFCHRPVCIFEPSAQLLFLSLFCLSIRAALISAFLPPRPNLASCFGLDELVAQWTKPVCLLHKPMFQAYTLWQLYRALQKKKSQFSRRVDKEMGGGKKKKN